MSSRKHARSFEDDYHCGKRVKLDNLFSELKLSDGPDKEDSLVVNPQIKQYSVFKKTNVGGSNTPINSYIAEKLINHFNNVITSSMAVLPWYNSRFVVLFHFQKWAVRLFNKFISTYNVRNNTRIRRVKDMDRLMKMIRDNNLTDHDFFNIILQENEILLAKLADKKNRMKQKEYELLEDDLQVKYNYWDTIKIDNDMDMTDAEVEADRIREVTELDDYMEVEQEPGPMESNYGSYYSEYKGA